MVQYVTCCDRPAIDTVSCQGKSWLHKPAIELQTLFSSLEDPFPSSLIVSELHL
jgi:hypothetical protein